MVVRIVSILYREALALTAGIVRANTDVLRAHVGVDFHKACQIREARIMPAPPPLKDTRGGSGRLSLCLTLSGRVCALIGGRLGVWGPRYLAPLLPPSRFLRPLPLPLPLPVLALWLPV